MKLIPKYSYEFNCILNDTFKETDQIQNFASLLSDKERFFAVLPLLAKNEKLIEKKLGYSLPEEIDFYVVRAEKFKSFSDPITIEYSLQPEEMMLFLLKEVLKVCITDRFTDELTRQQYVNAFIEYIAMHGEWSGVDILSIVKNLHNESEKLNPDYKVKELDFKSKTMKDYIERLYELSS